SDDDRGIGRDVREGAVDLAAKDFFHLTRLSFGTRFADADHGPQAGGQDGAELLVYGLVGLAEVSAALGVADQQVIHQASEHFDADLAGEGAFFFPVDVLGADAERGAFRFRGDIGEKREGREYRLFDAGDRIDAAGTNVLYESTSGTRDSVHFPVSGHDGG